MGGSASNVAAHRTHLAAKRPHVALLSGERANLAIVRHSPANLLNSSEGFIGPSSLCRILVLSNVRLHFSEALERNDDCTNLNSRLDAAVTLRVIHECDASRIARRAPVFPPERPPLLSGKNPKTALPHLIAQRDESPTSRGSEACPCS